MDGDGEDTPEDVVRLVQAATKDPRRPVVFAERRRRSESYLFHLFYAFYRYAHRLLTGIPVRVGNFSLLPDVQLSRLVVGSGLWGHYAAAGFKARLPRKTIPTTRGQRLAGRPRMGFI